MTRRRLLVLLLGIATLGVLSFSRLTPEAPSDLTSASAPEALQTLRYQGEVFGTTFSVKARAPSELDQEQLEDAVDASLTRVDESMSTYKEASELSRLNRAPAGEAQALSPALFQVLRLSQQVHSQTGGAFDVTVGPLVRAWGFGAKAASEPPSESELAELMEQVGGEHLLLDVNARTLTKERAGMLIDLSAVAKGYGVDQVAEALTQLGIAHFLVEVGGEVRAKGTASETRGWRLGIERPDPNSRSIFATLVLRDAALATSGDYRNFHATEAGIVSHTLDPSTGRPVPRRTASVSVVRPTAAEADALATALGVLPANEALSRARENGWAVLLLLHQPSSDFELQTSPAWRALDWARGAPPTARDLEHSN